MIRRLVLGCLPMVLGAQDSKPSSLAEILNTPVQAATRTSLRLDQVPATAVVIREEQIRQRRYRSLLDLLQDLPEFKLDVACDYVAYNMVTLRGLQGNGATKLLVLMDGVRITGPNNEPVPILENFPLHLADRVEVVYGPGSAVFGADAFAGIVNIITREESQARGEFVAEGGSGSLAHGSFFFQSPVGSLGDRARLLVSANAFFDGRPDLASRFPEDYAGLDRYRSGVLTAPWGAPYSPEAPIRPEISESVQANSLYLRLNLGDFSASIFHRTAKHPSGAPNLPAYSIYNNDVFIGYEQSTWNLNYARQLGDFRFQTNLTGQKLGTNPRTNYRTLWQGFEHAYEYEYASTHRLEQLVTWSTRPVLRVTGGFFLEESMAIPWLAGMNEPVDEGKPIGGTLLGTDIPADVYTLRDSLRGAFLQVEYSPLDQLSLTGGTRIDRSDRYGSSQNPRLGVVWTPNPEWTLKFLYGSAFLAPSPYDSYVYYGGFTPDGSGGYTAFSWHLPNPQLKPQTLRTLEFSLRRSLGSHASLSANLYQTTVHNLFLQAPDQGWTNYYNGRFKGWPVQYIEVYVNQGRQVVRGGTLRLDGALLAVGGWHLKGYAAYSWMDGTVADALKNYREIELANIAPRSFRLGLDWTWPRWSLSARLGYFGRQRLLDTEPASDRRRSLSGYTRVDLSFNFQLLRGLTVFTKVQNALDRTYRNVTPQSNLNPIEFVGRPQDPRRLALGLEWAF